MIKLIASDLDGTLLDKKGNLPQEIFPIVRRLFERGVLFVPASGRQAHNLENMFAPVKDHCAFIMENGALVRYRGQTLLLNPLAPEKVKTALDIVRETPGAYPILCSDKIAYIENDIEPFFTRTTTPYASYKLVKNLDEVIGKTPCCKISVFSEKSAEEQGYKALLPHSQGVKLTISGGHWCDVSAPTAHKGTAIKKIQEFFKIKREECLAFGDQMNDVEMLRACAHTAAPKNAHPLVKAQADKIIPANTDGGVIKALTAILETPRSDEQGVRLWTKNL